MMKVSKEKAIILCHNPGILELDLNTFELALSTISAEDWFLKHAFKARALYFNI